MALEVRGGARLALLTIRHPWPAADASADEAVRGGDRTIVVAPAFHAAEVRIADRERAARVAPVPAAQCTGLERVVARCNVRVVGVAAVSAIEAEDVVRGALRATREEQGESEGEDAS